MVYNGERAYIECFEPAGLGDWHLSMERHLEQWVTGLERMQVAEVKAEVAGYCFWEQEGDAATLASIHTRIGFRRKGVGAALLRGFESDARARGCRELRLGVLPTNPALHLYEACGYQFLKDDGRYLHYLKRCP